MTRPLRSLLFSTLYPSASRPGHGVFVETRLRKLVESGAVETKVVAPVPWFPSTHPRFGSWAAMARTPSRETRHGIDVRHPRYLHLPALGMYAQPLWLAAAAIPAFHGLIREGFDFDVIDAHYYYPDGVAAAFIARHFRRPFTVTARGSDLNVLATLSWPRALIKWAARRADANIGVSKALVERMQGWGLAHEKLHVMRNGVDLLRFRPLDPSQTRGELGLTGSPLLLSVGNLVDLKGHDLVIEAVGRLQSVLPDVRLAIVGEGPERNRLRSVAIRLGVDDKVHFAGRVEQDELARWYSAADMLILASSREGWANVLLESMACGTPVLATTVGGSPEVVAHPDAGALLASRDAVSIAHGVSQLWASCPPRDRVRIYAERFSWDATTRAQIELFNSLVSSSQPRGVHA